MVKDDDDDGGGDDDDDDKLMSRKPQDCFTIWRSPFQISVRTPAKEKVIVKGTMKVW
jgi:hypothetical protein